MHRVAAMLRRRTERFHMLIHGLFGVICGYIVHDFFAEASLVNLVFWGILGSLLPDLDHFLFFYIYGRKTEYSKIVRKYIKNRQFRELMTFWKFNHKKNTGLFSHNLLTIVISLYLFGYFLLVEDRATYSVLALAFFLHYLFDIGEDLLFMKRVNPNWFFKFGRKPDRKDLVIP